jgi:hypothetical protein
MPAARRRAHAWAALVTLLCALLATAAYADDVLRFRTTSLGGRTYCYWKFSNAARTFQSGDYIEYDVYLHTNAPGVGGIDIKVTTGAYFRDAPGWVDQNGLGGHPATDLRSVAYGKWYHRKLPVPASMVGKAAANWDVAVDGTYGSYDVPSAMYNNVAVTRNNAVVQWIYTDGGSPLNALDFQTGTVQSAHLLPTSPRRGPVQLSAHFFYWHDAPSGNADYNQIVYDPHGLANTGPWTGYGYGSGYSGYYSSLNSAWWEGAFGDVKKTGMDMVDLICWGNHPFPWFQMSALSNHMVPALERSGNDLKIALFDDTSSEACEWNQDNGRGYTVSPPMPLSNSNNWAYFYDRKIKPFFQAIPKQYWATHNGASIDAGGRPIIITYTSAFFTDVGTHGAGMWGAIKSSFARDFKTSSGAGITPWVIHEISWINSGASGNADSAYTWGAALNGPTINQVNGWYTGSVGPGYDDRQIRSPGNYHDRANGNWLISWYNGTYSGRKLWDSNLVLMETWNELWEGTGIDRLVDYPNANGGLLPETHYMDRWGQNCLVTSIGKRELDATFLRTWQIPTTLTRGSTSVTLNLRNDGLLPWTPNPIWVGVWLETAAGAVVPNTERWYLPPAQVLTGNETAVTFTTPADWPTGSYKLRMDVVWNGWTWFRWQGDNAGKIGVTIN